MNPVEIPVEQGILRYFQAFLAPQQADTLLARLSHEVDWRQDRIRLFGKLHNIPRLQAFQGDSGVQYTYSGLTLEAARWHPLLAPLRDRLCDLLHHPFNAALMNLYRDGDDSMGWHSDDETALGSCPLIASLSLGASRRFLLRRKDNHAERIELLLEHGSLLVMGGALQHHWQHSVPRTRKVKDARINLTFRNLV
jgi:alkylated DNA repair dioxygenase AlkB